MGLLQPGFAKELRALPLMTHSLFEQWGRTGRLVLQRRSQGRGRGRGVLSTQRSRHDTGKKRKESGRGLEPPEALKKDTRGLSVVAVKISSFQDRPDNQLV